MRTLLIRAVGSQPPPHLFLPVKSVWVHMALHFIYLETMHVDSYANPLRLVENR